MVLRFEGKTPQAAYTGSDCCMVLIGGDETWYGNTGIDCILPGLGHSAPRLVSANAL